MRATSVIAVSMPGLTCFVVLIGVEIGIYCVSAMYTLHACSYSLPTGKPV